jgi:ABC-type polysaccharide/polyol phosphate transport system ATPase subunit
MPEMSDDVLVKVDNVSKRFCRSLKRSLWYGLQDLGSEIGGRRHGGGSELPQSSADVQLRPDEFWAVKDVSFELRRGECLGLIGRNGAGKTTLLRMLNGLIKPDTGRIEMKGRVGALIALGAGFNPLLTGRENIRINGSILGLQENELKERIDEIIEFSEISDFIDSPIQSYSSGMQVRLGFAVASSLSPDILILDEVLAVGDRQFQAKCFNRIGEMRRNGCATILVSHYEHHLQRFCQSGVVLNKGIVGFKGTISEAIEKHSAHESSIVSKSVNEQDGSIRLRVDETGERSTSLSVTICIPSERLSLSDKNSTLWVEVVIRSQDGEPLFYIPFYQEKANLVDNYNGFSSLTVSFSSPVLNDTTLLPSFAVWDKTKTYSLATNSGQPIRTRKRPQNIGRIMAADVLIL